MPDASIRIEGRQIAPQVRFGQAGDAPVANLTVAAGRSRKNEQTGQWETLSDTIYDVAFWREHHDLIAGLGIQQGDTVIITGNVTGTDVYEGKAKVKVSGHGIQHFRKRDQGGGYQQSQGGGFTAQASAAPVNNGQWGAGTGGGAEWPPAAQPGQGYQQQGGHGPDTTPF